MQVFTLFLLSLTLTVPALSWAAPPLDPRQVERGCQAYGAHLLRMAQDRDGGVSYLQALQALRRHPSGVLEEDVRWIYQTPASPVQIRNTWEVRCMQDMAPFMGTPGASGR